MGSDRLRIRGVARLGGARHRIIPDRIETGTYMMAVAATGGEARLTGTRLDLVAAVARILEGAGVELTEGNDGILVRRRNGALEGVDVMTEPYPGFPTDLQAQVMALMATRRRRLDDHRDNFRKPLYARSRTLRGWAPTSMSTAPRRWCAGCRRLTGAQVMATDLRASVSLVVAGLVAQGETVINRVYHLDRGYERLEAKLAACGARIERLRDGA